MTKEDDSMQLSHHANAQCLSCLLLMTTNRCEAGKQTLHESTEILLQFLRLAPPSGIQSKVECPVALTSILTPTPVNVGERPRPLRHQNERFPAGSCTSLNAAERRAAGSTTAGRKFDSCPTCPVILNSWELLPRGPDTMCKR
jgi:hypothetical protein